MSKKKIFLDSYVQWWLKEDIQWNEIGPDVVNRVTEKTALNNIAMECKYIRNLKKWDIELTKEELYIQQLDLLVNSPNLDYSKYKRLYRKDTTLAKISKLSGYSENYINKTLKTITSKIYLSEIVGVSTNKNNYNSKKKYFAQKLKKYKRVI